MRDNIHGERKRNHSKNHTKTVQVEASISSLTLWRLETLSEQVKEKIGGITETAKDVAMAAGRHVSPPRGKGWVIQNWGLVRTCVGIFRNIN